MRSFYVRQYYVMTGSWYINQSTGEITSQDNFENTVTAKKKLDFWMTFCVLLNLVQSPIKTSLSSSFTPFCVPALIALNHIQRIYLIHIGIYEPRHTKGDKTDYR